MCDQDDFEQFRSEPRPISRREFGRMSLAAGFIAALPPLAYAGHTTGSAVDITTPDGKADAFWVHPKTGKHPAVLIWPDIFGLRPAFQAMATRLAEAGYAVLVVNPFYRQQRAPTAPENPSFDDPVVRQKLMALKGSLTPATAKTDAEAFIAFIDAQAATDLQRGVGSAGYCMGGPLVFQTAAAVPERVAAGATFHAGGLVTDKADSPHLLIPSMKAAMLIAIAENDDAKEPTVKDTLRSAFGAAERAAEIEVYTGTKHGWCPTDSRVYDHAQAEKAWARMGVFFSAL
jgi:carboxymethylenebutenolidase